MVGKLVKITKIEAIKLWALRYKILIKNKKTGEELYCVMDNNGILLDEYCNEIYDIYNFTDYNSYFYIVEAPNNSI